MRLMMHISPLYHAVSIMISATDIHLVMPSKLTNILAVGGVALATAETNSELGQLAVGDDACLYCCDPENIDLLVDAVTQLRTDQVLRSKLEEAAKVYALEHIDKIHVLKAFENKLEEVIQ